MVSETDRGSPVPRYPIPQKRRTIHHPCQSQQPSGYTQPAFFPTRQPFVENKTRSAEDYFGRTRFQAAFSNYFINTLLIRRKGEKDSEHDPLRKMLDAIDEGYSLILFPEGTRGKPEQMGKIKSGIARILSLRPELKYIPVFMTGMGRSLPKGELILLPYKASIFYGTPAVAGSTDVHEILKQITDDFEMMKDKYQVVTEDDE